MVDEATTQGVPKPRAELAYEMAVNLLTHEGDLVWARFNMLLVANSVLLTAMGVLATSEHKKIGLSLCLTILGLWLCFLWFFLTLRGFQRCNHYYRAVVDMEQQCLGESLAVMRRAESFDAGWARITTSGIAQPRYVALCTVVLFVLLYVAIFVDFVCQ